MLREEKHYPDPNTFKPERWLGCDRRQKAHPYNVAFGFGRRYALYRHCTDTCLRRAYHDRACPGQYLAEELVFTSIAQILARFVISPAQNDNGDPVIPSDDSTNGGITYVSSLSWTATLR